jgi:hypothetical protein
MKIVVSGSRTITDQERVRSILAGHAITTLIHGGAIGVDTFADAFAREKGIEVVIIKPNWRLGRGAGLAANKEMAGLADKLVAIHDGKSKGTAHMVKLMRGLGKPVDYHLVDGTLA